jgi:predicted acyl esterase
VLVDVRGSNDSEGAWEFRGLTEQKDLVEVIEWAAAQPWCNGNVGMVGCSYYGITQLLAAIHQPPSLKAIFPYDAYTDMYRENLFRGGIPNNGFPQNWFAAVANLNFLSGRVKDLSGFHRHFSIILKRQYPFDCDYYRERSVWPFFDRIQIPCYFGCDWQFFNLHLPGLFTGWEGVGKIPKKMLAGPQPIPRRPFAAYHFEALRWYDHWLKGMDTRVMEEPPIHLYIQGEGSWRSEREWPLARTEWRELFLGGPSGLANGRLLPVSGPDFERSYDFEPGSHESRLGHPRLTYRTEPLASDLEITGPILLTLVAKSSATDTDWLITFSDEAPDGRIILLTRGWLRASHREIDPERSTKWRPWHPHDKEIPLKPGIPEEFSIGLVPTSNLFRQGHRIRVEIASCDSFPDNLSAFSDTLPIKARNTVIEGKKGSRLLVPVIPR